MPYIPHTDKEVKMMLEAMGASSMEELYKDVPEAIRLKRRLELPDPLSESELVRHVQVLAGQNRSARDLVSLLGGGAYFHHVPPAVDQVISRSEFYTSYTPYQAEVSQGTLQAIFEYQTMVCELLGMEVANASMYDGAEAAAEAVLMAERIRTKNSQGDIVLAGSMNPLYSSTIKTYLAHSSREIKEIQWTGQGATDLDALKKAASGSLAVVVQHPNYFGCMENLQEIADMCQKEGAVMVVAVTEALSMAMLEPPGAMGADIVAAEGQSLGIPMGFGGPHLGLFASRQKHMRKMPGRLAGRTNDTDGRDGYVLTIATREQHIRRGKATSNICTNQGLLALASAVYMSLLGPEGLKELAAINRSRCEYLKYRLEKEKAGKLCFAAPTFNEFVLDLERPPGPVLESMKQKGFLAGIPLGKHFPKIENAILVTVTEMNTKNELDRFADELAETLKEAPDA